VVRLVGTLVHFILRLPTRLPWPLPALLAWALSWCVWQVALGADVPAGVALACGAAGGAALGWGCEGPWRRLLVAAGFPLLALAGGTAQGVPAWAWLLPAVPLLLLYPVGAWRDAPFFPTPHDALDGLAAALGAPAPQRLLDAGCGLGHGLTALHAQWPSAQLHGIERSRVLQLAAALRCRFASVRAGDIWAADWREHDLVYLFQRPESMPRAWAKALREMRPGSWLVSLEFEVPGLAPHAVLGAVGAVGRQRRSVWAYRVPAQPAALQADNPP